MNKKRLFNFIVITIVLFCLSINNAYADSNAYFLAATLCQREDVARIISLIQLLIGIIRVVVPIILIISVMIKLTKAMTSPNEINKIKKSLIINIVAAVLIFLVPNFVDLITMMTGSYDEYQECLKLSKNPVKPTKPTNPIINGGNSSQEKTAPSISSITHNASYVIVNAKKGANGNIAGYYFSKTNKKPTGKEDTWVLKNTNKLEIAKLPGTYYVFVKDSKNNISKAKTLKITWEELYNGGNGPISRKYKASSSNKSELTTPLSNMLEAKGDSFENFNDFIFWSVKSAGLFTSEGVATAGAAAIYYLYAKYNTQIPYNSNVDCAGTRYNVYFGARSEWGKFIATPNSDRAVYCKGTNLGLDCQSFVGWSIHNGGFKAENTAGSYRTPTNTYCKSGSCGSFAQAQKVYDEMEIGDILYSDAHKMLFVAHYDDNNDGINDGAYVFESSSPVGISKLSYKKLYAGGSVKGFTKVAQMRTYYSNSKNYACLQDKTGKVVVNVPDAWKDKASLFRSDCKATN